MKCKCTECDGEITVPKDAVNGEIVTEDEPVKNGDKVKILSVISGG